MWKVIALGFLAACGAVTVDDAMSDDTSGTDDTDVTDTDPGVCDTTHEDCGPGTCFGEGARMLPGSDCLACHTRGSGVRADVWTAGGTIFEADDGLAPASGVTVRITDDEGRVVELLSNAVGNFYTRSALTPPLTAEVERDGEVLTMTTPVPDGGCNACHACEGAAGGKLYAP